MGVVVRYDVVRDRDVGGGPGLGIYVDVLQHVLVGWMDIVEAGMVSVNGGWRTDGRLRPSRWTNAGGKPNTKRIRGCVRPGRC